MHNPTVDTPVALPAKRLAHPNRRPFRGILTRLDEPSDAAPSGARGHRVIVTAAAAQEALHSLEGMGVGFKDCWTGHGARQKCGVITSATIAGNAIHVEGYLYDRDFPEVAKQIEQFPMGMSFEICDAHVADMRQPDWTITRVTFTGAAILLRAKAAYRSTTIELTEGSAAAVIPQVEASADEDDLPLPLAASAD